MGKTFKLTDDLRERIDKQHRVSNGPQRGIRQWGDRWQLETYRARRRPILVSLTHLRQPNPPYCSITLCAERATHGVWASRIDQAIRSVDDRLLGFCCPYHAYHIHRKDDWRRREQGVK